MVIFGKFVIFGGFLDVFFINLFYVKFYNLNLSLVVYIGK